MGTVKSSLHPPSVAPLPPLPLDALDSSAEEIRARLDGARRRGRPRFPWHELEPAGWEAACRALAGCAAELLNPPRTGAVPVLRVPGDTVALGIAAYTTGTGAWLGRCIETGLLRAGPEEARLLELHLRHGRLRARRREELLDRVLPRLAASAAGARPVVVLKGAHTGRAYFPEPGTRPAADVDLLVPELDAAEAALADLGLHRVLVQRNPRRSTWRPAGEDGRLRSLHLDHVANPLTVDLHGSLARSFYGVATVDPGPLEDGDLGPMPGHPDARAPAPHLLLPYLALHASQDLHTLQLVRLVELVQVGRALSAEPDGWPRALERTRAAGGLRFTWPALELARRLADDAVDARYLQAARDRAPRRLRRIVDRMGPGTAQRLHRLTLQERLMWARGPVELLRRLAHMALPSSTGGSPRALAALYGERLWRLLRGGVHLSGAEAESEGTEPEPPRRGR